MYFALILIVVAIIQSIYTFSPSEIESSRNAEELVYLILFFVPLGIVLFLIQKKRNFVSKQEIITVSSIEEIRNLINPIKESLKEIVYKDPFELFLPHSVMEAGLNKLEPEWPLTLRSFPYLITAFLKKRYRYDEKLDHEALKLTYKNDEVKFVYYPLEYKDDALWNYLTELEGEGLNLSLIHI